MVAILWHAAALLGRNLGTALRLSIGPLVLAWALGSLLGRVLGAAGGAAGGGALGGGADSWVLGLLEALILAWLAVAWHRYVLLEEAPTGLLPPAPGPETLAYAMWTFLAQLALLLFAMTGGRALQALAAALPWPAGWLVVLALGVGIAWTGLRLGLVLPAAALGRRLDLAEAWRLSAPAAGRLGGVAAAVVAAGLLAPWLIPAGAPAAVQAGLGVALAWAGLMLGLSLLTTLYGHLVERRPLG